jgi:hypothetical protein
MQLKTMAEPAMTFTAPPTNVRRLRLLVPLSPGPVGDTCTTCSTKTQCCTPIAAGTIDVPCAARRRPPRALPSK